MSYKKFERPIRTETFITVGYNVEREISVLGETEKSIHIVYQTPFNPYMPKSSKFKDVLLWVPKSIWDNDKYFVNDHKGQRCFIRPVWL